MDSRLRGNDEALISKVYIQRGKPFSHPCCQYATLSIDYPRKRVSYAKWGLPQLPAQVSFPIFKLFY
jgi:hypothetical protein